MEINSQIIMKNMGSFTHAYGLEPNSKRLIEDISNGNGYVESVGILLREPVTKKGLINCQFPVNIDVTNQMVWVPLNEKIVEAVPIYTREVKTEFTIKSVWKLIKDKMNEDNDFMMIEAGDFKLRVHKSFCKHGVIEKYIPKAGYGFIRRNRKGIFFLKKWCNFEQIEKGIEVTFVPAITHKGLQARAVEEIR